MAIDDFHGPINNFIIEGTSQPTSQEAHMYKGPREHPVVTPDRGVGYPPCLHHKRTFMGKHHRPVLMSGNHEHIHKCNP